jgi:enterochelin esterase-like enzyme
MKLVLLASLIAAQAAPGPAPRPARLSSPEVGPDRRVTFRLAAPKATDVVVTGELLASPRPLIRGADGTWTATVGPVEPEIYHYNFIVDGVRTIDQASTTASVLEVRGQGPAFYDAQPVPHGEVRALWYQSKSLGRLRPVAVYTPPGYEESKAPLPVLYLLHGANADETAWYRLGRANFIIDNLLAGKKAKPLLVVMPFGYGAPPGDPAGQGQNTALFARDLIGDLIPFVEARFRARKDREHRALVGLSMGGGQALKVGLEHRDLFGYVAGFSSGLGRPADFPTTYASLIADPTASNKQLRLLWVGCGTEDKAFAASQAFSEFLTKNEIKHTFRQSPGAHSWMVWRRYLNEVAPLLFH